MMVAKRRITRTTFAILCTLILVLLLFFAWFNDSPSKLVTEEFFTTAPIPSFSAEPTALYLTYLPHSGFHNQRVSLENAFVLAALLNRTLIVPPARLSSKPIRYFPTRKLVSAIEISNDRTLEPCPTGQDFNDILGNDMCNPYGDFIHLSWRHLMPIDRLRNKIPFIERDDMRQGWFNASLNIPSDDVYWARDKSSYEFSFYDTPSGVSINPKYSRHIHLGDLSNQTQGYRLLHFGTLFGSGRLRLSDSSSFEHLKTVREAMALSNPLLNKLSDQVVKRIGGKDSYYAIHLRLRDGVFAENATANSQAILEAALLELFGTADESVYMNLTSVVPHLSHFDDRGQFLRLHRLKNSHHYRTNPDVLPSFQRTQSPLSPSLYCDRRRSQTTPCIQAVLPHLPLHLLSFLFQGCCGDTERSTICCRQWKSGSVVDPVPRCIGCGKLGWNDRYPQQHL